MTLRAQLSRVKDKLPPSMSSCVVYSCRKVYIGETTTVVDPGFGKGGFMRMYTVATTPPFDAHAHRKWLLLF